MPTSLERLEFVSVNFLPGFKSYSLHMSPIIASFKRSSVQIKSSNLFPESALNLAKHPSCRHSRSKRSLSILLPLLFSTPNSLFQDALTKTGCYCEVLTCAGMLPNMVAHPVPSLDGSTRRGRSRAFERQPDCLALLVLTNSLSAFQLDFTKRFCSSLCVSYGQLQARIARCLAFAFWTLTSTALQQSECHIRRCERLTLKVRSKAWLPAPEP